MRGTTFVVALSLVAAPNFAVAQVGGQAAKQVQMAVTKSFSAGAAPSVGQAPETAGARVIPVNAQGATKGVSSFREVSDILAAKGAARDLPLAFCTRFELDCGGKPWPIHMKGAKSQTELKNAGIGKIGSADIVVLLRKNNDSAKSELYVCDPAGNFIRAYSIASDNSASRMAPDQAKAGFESEKQWWMNWLPDNAVVAAETTASAK